MLNIANVVCVFGGATCCLVAGRGAVAGKNAIGTA
jgi:hypothetical protein